MALIWFPDVCPPSLPCIIELNERSENLDTYVGTCPRHPISNRSDAEETVSVFESVKEQSRTGEQRQIAQEDSPVEGERG